MIVFDLTCPEEHVFEAWFKDSKTFERQRKKGQVACPVCADTQVEKALMAPNISTSGKRVLLPTPMANTGVPFILNFVAA